MCCWPNMFCGRGISWTGLVVVQHNVGLGDARLNLEGPKRSLSNLFCDPRTLSTSTSSCLSIDLALAHFNIYTPVPITPKLCLHLHTVSIFKADTLVLADLWYAVLSVMLLAWSMDVPVGNSGSRSWCTLNVTPLRLDSILCTIYYKDGMPSHHDTGEQDENNNVTWLLVVRRGHWKNELSSAAHVSSDDTSYSNVSMTWKLNRCLSYNPLEVNTWITCCPLDLWLPFVYRLT